MYDSDLRMQGLNNLLAAAGQNQRVQIFVLNDFIEEELEILSRLPDSPQNRSLALDCARRQLRFLQSTLQAPQFQPPLFAAAPANPPTAIVISAPAEPVSRSLF